MLPADRETKTSAPDSRPRTGPQGVATLAPGSIVAGRYRIVSLLGRGGMGDVYRADDMTLGAEVALKFLPPHLADDPVRTRGLYDEVRAARQITHPNVCRVHDVGATENGQPFLAMEYVDGEDLARLLLRIGRLPAEKAIDIGQELCRGLAAVHEQGLVHRDLKPANVMLDSRGRVRLADFGIAALRGSADGQLAGTPAYMSPESSRGERATAASDVFALGLVLTEIFTGHRPSSADLHELARIEPGDARHADSRFKDLDERIRGILGVCLAAEPSGRPSAAWVAAALAGGDALQASVAAGHTPSPRAIALAPRSGVLDLRVGAACLASLVVLVAANYIVNDRTSLTRYRPLPHSPAALQFKAREHLRALGIDAPAEYWASGFDVDDRAMEAAAALPVAAQEAFLKTAGTSPVFFWYRASRDPLVPLSTSRVTRTDPAPTFEDVSISLNPDGTLVAFTRVPPRAVVARVSDTPAPDWPRVFALAALDFATFEAAAPRVTIDATAGDARFAWLERRGGSLGPRRVEASTFRHEIVSFWNGYDSSLPAGGSGAVAPNALTHNLAARAASLTWDLLLVAGVFITWRQLRRGRADVTGAARLGVALLLLSVATQLLVRERLLATLGSDPISRTLPNALAATAEVMIFYLAVEAFIRRYAPHQFISWSRLLSGQITDPLVGRDVLIGMLCGVLAMLIARIGFGMDIRGIGPAYGATLTERTSWDAVNVVGYLLYRVQRSVTFTLLTTLIFAAGLMTTRRVWAASVINLTLVLPYVLMSYQHWTGMLVGALTLPIFVGLGVRVGVLADVAMVTAFYALHLDLTSDVSNWRFAPTFVAGLAVLGLACVGFATSTGLVGARRAQKRLEPLA